MKKPYRKRKIIKHYLIYSNIIKPLHEKKNYVEKNSFR